MGSLRDTAYENLDYLSQLTEVVIGPQNEVLAKIPDRIEYDIEKIRSQWDRHWGSGRGFELRVENVLYHILSEDDRQYVNDLAPHFEFQMSEDFELDLENNKMTGRLVFVKTNQQVEEKRLLEIAVDNATRQLHYYNWPSKNLKQKIATVLNTFELGAGTEWILKHEGRVSHAAQQKIRETMREVILENKWRVRDATIIEKIGVWVNSYLSDETDTSTGLVNLIKLKFMLDKDLPVYSVDEVTNVKPTGTN